MFDNSCRTQAGYHSPPGNCRIFQNHRIRIRKIRVPVFTDLAAAKTHSSDRKRNTRACRWPVHVKPARFAYEKRRAVLWSPVSSSKREMAERFTLGNSRPNCQRIETQAL